MPTNSTNTYLRFLPIVILVGLIPCFAEVMNAYHPINTEQPFSTFQRSLMMICYAIPQMVVLTVLSIHFKRPLAILSVLICVIDIPISVMMWNQQQSLPVHLLYRMFQGLPYLLWGFLMLRDQRALSFLLFLLFPFAMSWINGGSAAFYGMNFLSVDISRADDTNTSLSLLYLVKHLFLYALHYILMAEFYQWAEKGIQQFKGRLLHLSNQYTSAQALILFLGYRWMILLCLFGSVTSISYLTDDFDQIRENATFLAVPIIALSSAVSLIMLIALLYLYRKFMMEYSFQKGQMPSYLFWLMTIPLLGTVLFLILMTGNPNRPLLERLKVFNEAVALEGGHRTVIRTFIIVGQVLAIIGAFLIFGMRSNVIILLLGLITATVVIAYLYLQPLIYVILGLFIFKIIIVGINANEYFASHPTNLPTFWMNTVFESAFGFYIMYYLAGTLHTASFDAAEDDIKPDDQSGADDLIHFAPEID